MSMNGTSRRTAVVLGGLLVQFIVIGGMFAYGVFFHALEAEFGWSRTMLSACSSLAFLTMGLLAIVAGRSSDRHGPRVVLMITGLVFGLGYAALSQITQPWHLFVLFGLLVGVGLSSHDVVTLSTVARWFPDRRGQITGIVKAGTAAGQVLVPFTASVLILWIGWRDAFLVMGLVATVMLQFAAWPMKAPPPMLVTASDAAAAIAPASSSVGPGMSFAQIRRTRQFWTFCAIQFVFFPALMTLPVHIVVHGVDLGLSTAAATGVLSTLGGTSVIGRLAIGMMVDRVGGRNGLLICFVLLLGSLAVLMSAGTLVSLYLFAVIYGTAHGGFFTVVSPALAEFFGMSSHGTAFGVVLFFGTLGGALGPLLAGRVFDVTGSYDPAFITLTVLASIGLLLTLSLRPIAVRRAPGTADQ